MSFAVPSTPVSRYHRGELIAQQRAGVLDEAARLTAMFNSEMPRAAAAFLAAQPMIVLSATDPHGNVWATMLTGAPGFITATTPSTIEIAATPTSGDPLHETLSAPSHDGALSTSASGSVLSVPAPGGALPASASGGVLSASASGGVLSVPASGGVLSVPASGGVLSVPASGGALPASASGGALSVPAQGGALSAPARIDAPSAPVQVGMIAIEPGTRRRVRMNGAAHPAATGLRVELRQVYANCPKYIQKRRAMRASATPGEPRHGVSLTAEERAFIGRADTFFIATADPDGNADASHRGGNPGFLSVLSPTHLRWPDYAGNSMFNTFGNLELNPRAGLLIPDWPTGTLLHLTGTAVVDWDPAHAAAVPGAERLVDFTVERVVRIDQSSSLRWTSPELSRFNPPAFEG
ncbi:pyridoxamine 5'-phosphate oxidase family protein [Actinoplanes sp. CA-054009]